MNMMSIDSALLIFTALAALWTVMGRSLLKATIGLALTSALISIMIFRLNCPLAAVFELSVCAGLITAIFVSTISLTKPLTHKEILQASKDRVKRYIYLPIILIIVGVSLCFIKVWPQLIVAPSIGSQPDVRSMLWDLRRLDLVGQVIILLAGAIGVVLLFEERKSK
jgi:NADH-quinone oxidoreductase subunit J